MELVVLPEIQKVLFPLREEELAALEESVLKEGIRDALVVWPREGKLVLLDGHHRYRLAQKHGLQFQVQERHFANLDEALAWVDANQLARRNLTDEQRLVVLGRMYERQKKQGKRTDLTCGQNVHKLETGTAATAKAIAAVAGVNEKTVRRAAEFARAVEMIEEVSQEAAIKILKGVVKDAITELPKASRGDNQLIRRIAEKIASGETDKIKEAKRAILVEEVDKAGELNGKYRVIYADPPWQKSMRLKCFIKTFCQDIISDRRSGRARPVLSILSLLLRR